MLDIAVCVGFFFGVKVIVCRAFLAAVAVTRSLAISHGADARTDREGAG